jgi:DNA-binding NarL/FixJ family response regulator
MAPLKAFIVEDSPVIRENLIATLEEMVPLRVVGTADDEAGAVQWLADPRNECDLAIVDVFLRHGSGLGVLRAMQRRRPEVECVVLTNYATPDMRRQAIALGATRLFDKSADIDELVMHCLAKARPMPGGASGGAGDGMATGG